MSVDREMPGLDAKSPEEALKIVLAYDAVMAGRAPPLGYVADASELPVGKQLIKSAIILCLESNPDTRMRERLRAAYLALADWQEGVGAERLQLTLLNGGLSGDPLGPGPAKNSARPDMDGWNIRVVDERVRLAQELRERGLEPS